MIGVGCHYGSQSFFYMLKKIKNSKTGFTLAEVLISILLLAIVMSGGLQFYFSSAKITGLLTHKKFATELANSLLEDLKKDGYSNLPAVGPGTATALTSAEDPLNILKDLSGTKTITVTNIGSPVQYKQVDVIVAWTEAGESTPRTNTLVTLIAP